MIRLFQSVPLLPALLFALCGILASSTATAAPAAVIAYIAAIKGDILVR